MKLTRLCFFILILTSCFRNPVADTIPATKPSEQTNLEKQSNVKMKPDEILTKAQRESIYFSAQLEKEALKLLLKNPSFNELTLFSVLNYAVENSNGVKKSPPGRLDCSRFRLQPMVSNKRQIHVYQTCQKPDILIAQLDIGLTSSSMTVTFFLKEWIRVVGLPVTLTGANTICDFQIESNKLEKLDCKDWAYTVSTSSVSSEELRLKEFLFRRHQPNQFVIKGGRFVDLIERKKFDIQIPMEGKIKIFEKEIKVIDEFADRVDLAPPTGPPPKNRIEIKGVPLEEEATKESYQQKEDSIQNQDNIEKANENESIPQEEVPGETRKGRESR